MPKGPMSTDGGAFHDGASERLAMGDGFELHVRRHGPLVVNPAAAPTTLVYLHSLGSDQRIWDGVIARLPAHAHLRFDQRGHGRSDTPPGPYAMTDLADDLLGLLDAYGLRRVVLVGVSVGGMIAMRAAVEHPEVFRGLVLCDTAGKVGDEQSWNERIAAVRELGVTGIADQVMARWYPPSFRAARPSAYEDLREMLTSTSPDGYVATCAALRDEDLRPHLGDIHLPTLVLGGSEDGSTPPEMVRALAASLPNARFELVDGAGHLPSTDAPEAVAELVAGFLDEIG